MFRRTPHWWQDRLHRLGNQIDGDVSAYHPDMACAIFGVPSETENCACDLTTTFSPDFDALTVLTAVTFFGGGVVELQAEPIPTIITSAVMAAANLLGLLMISRSYAESRDSVSHTLLCDGLRYSNMI